MCISSGILPATMLSVHPFYAPLTLVTHLQSISIIMIRKDGSAKMMINV